MYPRFYRHWIKNSDLVSFNVVVDQTDLYIRARRNLKTKAAKSVLKHRSSLERYIEHHPLFLTTLEPYQVEKDAPAIIEQMTRVSQIAGVGPMAAVAGAIAEAVGKDLLAFSPEVIVENGGDIFLKILQRRLVGIYAGEGVSLIKKIALQIEPQETPLGICTSSASIGHSLSLGDADTVTVLSSSTPLADAMATAIGNIVRSVSDIPLAIQRAQKIEEVHGIVIIKDGKMGIWGNVKIVPLD